MENERVLGYRLATEITHEEMNEVTGGAGTSANSTFGTTNEYTHPIGTDIVIDQDFALDA